jgi:hypothetical protein
MSNARSLANLISTGLSQYDEGTWTVKVYDATVQSPTTVTGNYVRVGDLVQCWFDSLNNIDTSGLTGTQALRIELPFNTSEFVGVGSVLLGGVSFAANMTYVIPVVIASGTNRCVLRTSGSGQNQANLLVSDFTSGVSDITYFGFTYKAA